jgi:NAD(P)-dependent dehydrogenase (short-subunit alcohol dehydrogenase family)
MTRPIAPDDESKAGTALRRNASVAVVGAGDYIGAAIARRFARAGYIVFAGRRHGDKLAPLVADIEAEGGVCIGRALDARQEESITRFIAETDAAAPLEVAVFNIGANVNFPLLETTERVFRKVWELACYAGFLTGRGAARHMLPHGSGSIFLTGATASLRGGVGYAAFASAKFGLRAVAQSMARELGPKTFMSRIWSSMPVSTPRGCASGSGRGRVPKRLEPDRLVNPASIAEVYWQLHQQPRDSWTHELDIRPYREPW